MTFDAWIRKRGYKRHEMTASLRAFKPADHFYQRCIRDGETRLYYIDVWFYSIKGATSVSPECQLRLGKDVVNLTYIGMGPEMESHVIKAEELFATAYRTMGCTPYEDR